MAPASVAANLRRHYAASRAAGRGSEVGVLVVRGDRRSSRRECHRATPVHQRPPPRFAAGDGGRAPGAALRVFSGAQRAPSSHSPGKDPFARRVPRDPQRGPLGAPVQGRVYQTRTLGAPCHGGPRTPVSPGGSVGAVPPSPGSWGYPWGFPPSK